MNIERTNRNVWIGLGLILLLGLVAFSTVGGGMMGHERLFGYGYGYGSRPFFGAGPWFWGFGLIGLVIRLAVWGVLIMFGVRFFRRFSASSAGDRPRSEWSSLEILKQRYAAGEITREQYDEMRTVLDPSQTGQ